jgi:hypothetical protein
MQVRLLAFGEDQERPARNPEENPTRENSGNRSHLPETLRPNRTSGLVRSGRGRQGYEPTRARAVSRAQA